MPIYLQIIEAIKYHVATGTLSPHDELPSVRSLAKEYLINPNTVARAYLELERDGMIYKKRGMGTFVAEKETSMSQQEKMKIVRDLFSKAWIQASELGLSEGEMVQVFDESRQEFTTKDRPDPR